MSELTLKAGECIIETLEICARLSGPRARLAEDGKEIS